MAAQTTPDRRRPSLAEAAERHEAEQQDFVRRLGEARRSAEAQRERDDQIRQAGYRVGYREGTHWGMFCGAVTALFVVFAIGETFRWLTR